MRPLYRLLLLIPVLVLAACADSNSDSGPGGSQALRSGPFKLLVYSRTAGFRHPSIEPGIQVVRQLGADNGFTVDATEDPAQFTPQNLAQYDVVMFLNTTLDVLGPAEQAAFEQYIRGGGSFVGVHSAADTEHDWPFYGELVGAYFQAHPVLNQPGVLRIEDESHPSTAHLPRPWQLPFEEFYSFSSNPRGAVRVLLSIDEGSYRQEPNTSCDPRGPTFPQGYSGVMGDHPISWCHDKFAGRAWYTALGHEPYLYFTPDYQQHLLNGILTAARRVAASCAVNPKPADVPDYVPPELRPCEAQLLP
ncbi:MAG TPA: ThuA domain-containing protein [Nevskiales bacterium]|nr:ThuA domain-containing protein [Nevskiales bacterium]